MNTDLRERALVEAEAWMGTPYCHQAARKGAGCDCLGLIRGIWRHLHGAEPAPVPPYTPNWSEGTRRETLLEAAQCWLVPLSKTQARPGDVLLFRMSADMPCQHLAVLSGPATMIHAYSGRGVIQSYMVPYWLRRWAYTFSFPTLED